MHPVKDVLRILNEELEKHMIGEGWDHFFIKANRTQISVGNFYNEWECISLNLTSLGLNR